MTPMRDSVVETIKLFAQSMDMNARPAEDGSYTFVFDRSGEFTLTNSEDGERIHVSLARIPYRSDATSEQTLFEQAGLDPTTNSFLHVGLGLDGSFIGAIDVEVNQFDLPSLEACFRRLNAALDNAA